MNIFITGATGYIGGSIAAGLLARGHTLTGLARSGDASEALRQLGITPVSGSLDDGSVLAEAASSADAVVNAQCSGSVPRGGDDGFFAVNVIIMLADHQLITFWLKQGGHTFQRGGKKRVG